jgi:hypothetical protein
MAGMTEGLKVWDQSEKKDRAYEQAEIKAAAEYKRKTGIEWAVTGRTQKVIRAALTDAEYNGWCKGNALRKLMEE